MAPGRRISSQGLRGPRINLHLDAIARCHSRKRLYAYIRGSNIGPLYPHRSPRNDPRIHGLETISLPDLTNCVAVPVRAGDAVIHLSRTLHSAGVNTSDQPRRAYILGYSVRTRRDRILIRDYPWNLEKQTAREQRALQSLPLVKRTIRRFRRFARGKKF